MSQSTFNFLSPSKRLRVCVCARTSVRVRERVSSTDVPSRWSHQSPHELNGRQAESTHNSLSANIKVSPFTWQEENRIKKNKAACVCTSTCVHEYLCGPRCATSRVRE